MEVYDRFGAYMIHAGREDRYGGGDGESLDYYPTARRPASRTTSCPSMSTRSI